MLSTFGKAGSGDGVLADLGRRQMAAARAVGRHSEAIAAARRWHRRRPHPDLALLEAEALLSLLRFAEALVVTDAALARGVDAETQARLRVVRAQGLFMTGRAKSAWVEIQRAGATAATDLSRGQVAETQALFAWRELRFDEAREHVHRAWDCYEACASTEGLGRVLEKEAGILRNAGRFEEAVAAQGHRLEIASATTRLDLMAEARMDRGDLFQFLGRWLEARRDFDGAISLFHELGDTREQAQALPKRAMLDLACGELDAVRSALSLARASSGEGSSPWLTAEHALLSSDLELAAGRPEVAEAAAVEAVSLFAMVRSFDGICRARVRRSHALLSLGRFDEALREARRAVAAAPACRPDLVVLAALAEGRSLLRVRRVSAREAFDRALRVAHPLKGLAAAARLGLALARGDERQQAEVGSALAELEGWGDRRLVELARADLLALSGPRQQPSVALETFAARFPEIVGRSHCVRELFEQMAKAAASSLTIHVFGETGTGKEKVAHALHRHSPVAGGPFVAVNASSLSDELFEGEMFGHTRGAFTGAVIERRGYVAEAEGGTLFLDEIADLSPRSQARLLRFLQSGEYRRLGETHTRRAAVRVISAANVPLAERVKDGRFRDDLLYRIAGMTLTLPPLRERGDDVALLARHFLKTAADRERVPCPALSAEIVEALRRHAWPGNIRELENVIHQLLVMASGGPLRADQLAIPPGAGLTRAALRAGRAGFERELIARALAAHESNRTRTAASLGISRQALLAKIRRYALD